MDFDGLAEVKFQPTLKGAAFETEVLSRGIVTVRKGSADEDRRRAFGGNPIDNRERAVRREIGAGRLKQGV